MQEILGSLVEPLDTFQKHYTNDCADSYTKCSNFMNKYKDLLTKQMEARDRYFFLKEKAQQHDI
jgi:type III secretory pathway component EscR